MEAQVCCVDHQRPGTRALGGRWFCDEHFAKATYKRGGVWTSQAAAVVGLLVFVAAVVAVDTFLQPVLSGALLLLVGVVLALVPALLWLTFFYRQDRLEPEPVGHVARMFVIGLALASAIGIPLTDQVFRVSDWLYRSPLTQAIGSIALIGAIQAFIVYATVRYFIFDSPEFDERTDGVVYATAAGLGYATALNLQFILSNGGAALGTGEVFVAEVALAQAAFGGLLGYFLGRAKLEREPSWWLAAGVGLTALLNGAFLMLRGQLDQGTIERGGAGGLPSISGLVLSGVLAVLLTALVSYLVNRDIARSLGGDQTAPSGDQAIGDRQANTGVLALVGALLLVSALIGYQSVTRAEAFERDGFRGAYPASFSDATGEGEVLRVVDTWGTGAEFAIAVRPLEADTSADAVAAQLAGERSTDFVLYKVTESGTTEVGGRPAVVQQFAYVDPNGLTGALPEVRSGVDYIVVDGERAVIISLLTTPDDLADAEPLFARFLNRLSF